MIRKGLCWAMALLAFFFGGYRVAAAETEPEAYAGGIALMEVTTGKLLYGKNAHAQLPMASTTKVMTALLALEHAALDDMLTVPSEAYGVEGSSMYLNLGEKISLRDLLYGLMLTSGNDAAITIAEYVGGSVQGFIDMMNARAAELGALNTHFVTPNGLHDENHYTSAYDLALISAEALRNETFREIVSTTYHTTTTGEQIRTLKNKNKILWQYEGGNGVKTGFTKAAGKCLVFSAQHNGMFLVGVVLNCPNMFPDAMKVLDYGFQNFSMEALVKQGDVVTRVPVIAGKKKILALTAKTDIIVPVQNGNEADYQLRTVLKGGVCAPISKGQVLGALEVWDEGNLLCSVELVADQEIAERDFGYYMKRILMDAAS